MEREESNDTGNVTAGRCAIILNAKRHADFCEAINGDKLAGFESPGWRRK